MSDLPSPRSSPSPSPSPSPWPSPSPSPSPPPSRTALRTGFALLAISIPGGVVLEALHAFKSRFYLASQMRRELWRLAHAHGTLLGLLCLVFAALAERHLSAAAQPRIARLLATGAVLMPVGFFLGGILNSEGDPSLAIVLVPLGAVCLLAALVRCAVHRS